MSFFSLASVPPLISSILFIFIGTVVYKHNKKSSLTIPFFALCFTTFIWQFAMFLLFNTKDPNIANILIKVAHTGIIFLSVTMYHFVLNFVGTVKKIDKYFLFFSYIVAIFFEISLFTNWLIDGFYVYFWSFYPRAGILHPLFLCLLTITVIRLFYLLLLTLYAERKSSSILYYQIKYLLWAVFFYFFAAFDFSLNYGFEFYPIGFLFILIFMSITSYAIVKRRFMDIKIVFRQSSVYLVSFFVIIILAIALSVFNDPNSEYFIIKNLFIILSLALLFPFVKEYFFKLANKYFFTSLYNSQEVVGDLSYKLRSTLDLDYIYEAIFDAVDSAFHPESFGFLTFNSKNNVYTFKYKKGKFKNISDVFEGSFKFHQYYIKKNRVVIFSELEEENDLNLDKIITHFKKIKVEVLVPVNIKWRNIGLLIVGKKETNDIYSDGDIDLLEVISGLGATAIENGAFYKKINKKNKELEKLLEVKTNFLRITNHQLNTPLSIMRLAYNSVEEKNISIEEGFFMAKEGVNRLSNVIFQLWMVLELESGKMILKEERVGLLEIYNEVMEEKYQMHEVKKKKLKLSLNAAKNIKDFSVLADRQKIRNIFSGLLDNAIFYTENGSVEAKLEKVSIKKKFFIKTSIIDTGVGISAEDRKNIFENFFRGKKAGLLHPDGSGIGLYIAKNVIEASGGIFLLEKDSERKGSIFSFTLPVYED